ncbi:MAG: GGDEF domain-containing protein [Bdellovibrionaceae bacterium]|nr:GGDEF domain-containing protein [Pseudobdellovibrionaceae bacterium]
MDNYTHIQINDDLNGLFDTLSLSTVVKRSLNYLSVKIASDNVLWILAEEANLMLAKKKNYVAHSRLDRSVFLSSQTEVNTETFLQNFLAFNLEENLEKLKSQGYLSVDFAQKSQILVPIVNPGTLEIETYLIFTNVKAQDKSAAVAKSKLIIQYMTKHLMFCIEHYMVREQSFLDDVTDLYNQRYLPLVLDKEISRSKREKDGGFAVLFLDIDYFKAVNDTCGHQVGSHILVEISDIIKNQIRTSDFAFRYGGDEFVLILTQTDVDKAQVLAERIRQAVESMSFAVEGGPSDLKLTVSIGLAGFPTHASTSEQIIQLADDAMYLAKNKSRNTIYVAAS